MAFRIDDDENRIQDLTDQIEQLEIQTFSPEVVARNESTRNTGVQTGDGAATNPYPEWYPVRDFGTLGNLTLEILLNRTDSQIAKMTLNGDVDFAFSLPPPLNKGMWFILDVTMDGVGGHIINLPGNVIPASTTIDNTANARTVLRFTTTDGGTTFYAENLETGGGGTTGTFVSADLTADQITNLAVGDHVEFDRNTPPTGADGGIVLQTGAGQANGIFELKIGKTYFLSAAVAPFFGAANDIDLVWFDITNTTEIGRRSRYSDAVLAMNQPKAEISFTPLTDVTVELRLVAATTPANLNGYDADHTFASIFEFSGKNGAAGAPGAAGSIAFKDPARAKTLVDVPSLAAFDVITDGVTLVEGDRVLLTEQATSSENGIYDVGVVTTGTAPLTRSSDLDDSAELVASIILMVEEGSQFENTMWQLISDNPLTIGVSNQLWQQFGSAVTVGPDLGQDGDGFDQLGSFVFDGRVGIGFDRLKRWESFFDEPLPDASTLDMIYLPSIPDFTSPFAATPGRIVASGRGGSQTTSITFSDDYNQNWVKATNAFRQDVSFVRMAFDPVAEILIAVGSDPIPLGLNNIIISTDRGADWTGGVFTGNDFNLTDVIWSAADSQFVLVAVNGTTSVYTSPDGTTWTGRTTPAPTSGTWLKIAFDSVKGLYMVTGQNNADVMTSPDAITWTAIPTVTGHDGNIFKLLASEGHGIFIGMRSNGNSLVTEDNGVTWTTHSMPDVGVLSDFTIASDLSLFVAIGEPTAGGSRLPIFWASNDGKSWFQMPFNTIRIHHQSGTSGGGSIGTNAVISYAEEYGYFFGAGMAPNQSTSISYRFYRTEVSLNNELLQNG